MALLASSVQLISLFIVISTLFISVMAIRRWSKSPSPLAQSNSETSFLPRISLVLPTWNEEKVIEGKLEGIKSQNYPKDLLEVIIIDAASTDSTIEIVEDWLVRNNLADNNLYKVIREDERRGKSVSINRAFKEASHDSEILMMSDVDCRLSDGAVFGIAQRFSDPLIGAVSGRQILLNREESITASGEASYRDFFTRIRTAESILHSTPIFHGECSAYRRKAISEHQLVENSNADDSQMAVSSVRSGFRAIYDPEITFFEMAPPDGNASQIQKVRRAQGLVRHFWRNRDMIVDSRYGKFRKIMALEFILHIIIPIVVVLGFFAGFSHMGLLFYEFGLSVPSNQSLLFVDTFMLAADIIVILLLFSGFLGLPIPASRLSFTFFNYMITLFKAQLLILRGRSLHQWQQVSAVRDMLAEYDKNS